MKVKHGKEEKAINAGPMRGPCFGGEHDICIGQKNGNNMKTGYTRLNKRYYEIPSGAADTFLTGTTPGDYFDLAEVEVFEV